MTLHSFTFHDRNLTEAARAGSVPAGDRVALIAFDVEAVRSSWQTVTGAELVAPAPRAALAGFPPDVPLRGPPAIEDLSC